MIPQLFNNNTSDKNTLLERDENLLRCLESVSNRKEETLLKLHQHIIKLKRFKGLDLLTELDTDHGLSNVGHSVVV